MFVFSGRDSIDERHIIEALRREANSAGGARHKTAPQAATTTAHSKQLAAGGANHPPQPQGNHKRNVFVVPPLSPIHTYTHSHNHTHTSTHPHIHTHPHTTHTSTHHHSFINYVLNLLPQAKYIPSRKVKVTICRSF